MWRFNFLKLSLKLPFLGWIIIGTVFFTLFNFYWLKSPILGVFLLIFWLIGLMTGILGTKIAPTSFEISKKAIGLISGVGIIIFISVLGLWLINLNSQIIIINFIIINFCLLVIVLKRKIKLNWQRLGFLRDKKINWWVGLYIILWLISVIILFLSQSNEAILSPWQKVPKLFFAIYFLGLLSLIKIIYSLKTQQTKQIKLGLILISLYYFLSLSVAWIVYQIGYGFDAFVHRAAESKLMELGYIVPFPLYYAGQYSLIVFLSKLFNVSLVGMDKIILPALAALILPGVFYSLINDKIKKINLWLISLMFGLGITISSFFYSLPQNLANLFLLSLIVLSFYKVKIIRGQNIFLWFLCGVIFLIHPLSGVAGLIYLIINLPVGSNKWLRSGKYLLASCLAPLFFMVAAWLGKIKIELSLQNLNYVQDFFEHSLNYLPFYSIYHLIYLFSYNWLIVYLLIFIIGIYFLWQGKQYRIVKRQLKLIGILAINLILLALIKFGQVINYEQGEFIKRWGQIIILVSLPASLYGIYFLLDKVSCLNKAKWLIALLAAGTLTIGLYLSYPHHDAFVKARGYSVSQYDIQAVRWIANQNNGDYIVLANQSVSAAALQEFGFKKYYMAQDGQKIFYYPLPTSSPLYEIYLKMVYQGPKIEYINQARQLVKVKKVYLVINDYWLDAKKIIKQAQDIADNYKEFNGRVWVFEFD